MVLLHGYGRHCGSCGSSGRGALSGAQRVAASQGGLKSALLHDLPRLVVGPLFAFDILLVEQRIEGAR